MYAMKVLRAHGMDDAALQTIYRSVVIAKLQYASNAWWRFTNTSDRQRLEASIRRSARCNFATADLGSFEELCGTTDERLFDSIADNKDHVLHHLLPSKSAASQCYNLRPRTHNFKLPERSTRLTDCNISNECYYRHLLNTPSFIKLTNLCAILLFLTQHLVFTFILRSCSSGCSLSIIKRICIYMYMYRCRVMTNYLDANSNSRRQRIFQDFEYGSVNQPLGCSPFPSPLFVIVTCL